jgi:hypothetical protein
MGMINRNKLLVVGALCIFFFPCQGGTLYTINPGEFIYGKWQYESHVWCKFTKYTDEQVAQIQASTLHIEKDRIYFEGLDFIKPRTFTSEAVKINKLSEFDEKTLDVTYSSSGPLRYEYSQREFQELYQIELGPPYELAVLYLDQEVIIVNYCGGVSFRMKKLPHVQKVYQGKGIKAEYTLNVPEHSSFLKLSYRLNHVQAWLTVTDQDGRILCETKTGANKATKTVKLPVSQVNALTFKVMTANPNTGWKLDAAIY